MSTPIVNYLGTAAPTALGLNGAEQPSATDPHAELRSLLDRWFYKPDHQVLRIAMGTIQSHYLNLGDPAWLFVVAPPGCGKTAITVMGAAELPEVVPLSDISDKAFLSGFYGHRDPGILEKLGETTTQDQTFTTVGNGVLLLKDFTTVLSMRREQRSAILGQLREIYDGEFRRTFGTGVTKVWKGRVGMIAAVTPALDRHYSIFSTLGERFLQVRWHRPDSPFAGEKAIDQQGDESQIRQDAQRSVGQIFQSASEVAPILPASMRTRVASIAELVAIGRTHIDRNSYGSREIEYVPEPEANTRLSKGLAALAKGIASIQGRTEVVEQDLQDVFRVGLDCINPTRRELLVACANGQNPNQLSITRSVRRRQLEELEALGLVEKINSGDDTSPSTPSYKLTEQTAHLFDTASLNLI